MDFCMILRPQGRPFYPSQKVVLNTDCTDCTDWLSVESCQSVVGSDSSSFNGYAAMMN